MRHDALTTLAVLLISGMLLSAPLPRPKPRPAIVGTTWTMVHDTSTYWGRFHPDGTYESGRPGDLDRVVWAGTWRMDGNTLTVREAWVGCDTWLHWTAEVEPSQWQGTYFDSNGRTGVFRLAR